MWDRAWPTRVLVIGFGNSSSLASAYGIVKGHNGYIDVESAVGVGTTVRVDLPVNGG